VATVSAGYADGYPRAQSNVGRVLIRGKYAPILGRVCMDQFMVDVSDISEAELRDEVILFGTDGVLSIPVEEVA
jgi:alanine racemase